MDACGKTSQCKQDFRVDHARIGLACDRPDINRRKTAVFRQHALQCIELVDVTFKDLEHSVLRAGRSFDPSEFQLAL